MYRAPVLQTRRKLEYDLAKRQLTYTRYDSSFSWLLKCIATPASRRNRSSETWIRVSFTLLHGREAPLTTLPGLSCRRLLETLFDQR